MCPGLTPPCPGGLENRKINVCLTCHILIGRYNGKTEENERKSVDGKLCSQDMMRVRKE